MGVYANTDTVQGTVDYTYDALGRLVKMVEQSEDINNTATNRTVTTELIYNGQGERVLKTVHDGTQSETIAYIGDYFEFPYSPSMGGMFIDQVLSDHWTNMHMASDGQGGYYIAWSQEGDNYQFHLLHNGANGITEFDVTTMPNGTDPAIEVDVMVDSTTGDVHVAWMQPNGYEYITEEGPYNTRRTRQDYALWHSVFSNGQWSTPTVIADRVTLSGYAHVYNSNNVQIFYRNGKVEFFWDARLREQFIGDDTFRTLHRTLDGNNLSVVTILDPWSRNVEQTGDKLYHLYATPNVYDLYYQVLDDNGWSDPTLLTTDVRALAQQQILSNGNNEIYFNWWNESEQFLVQQGEDTALRTVLPSENFGKYEDVYVSGDTFHLLISDYYHLFEHYILKDGVWTLQSQEQLREPIAFRYVSTTESNGQGGLSTIFHQEFEGDSDHYWQYIHRLFGNQFTNTTKRYFVNGQALAQRIGNDLYYITQDATGLNQVVMDNTGQVMGQTIFDGLGGVLTSTVPSTLASQLVGAPEDSLTLTSVAHVGGGQYMHAGLGRVLQMNTQNNVQLLPRLQNAYMGSTLNPANIYQFTYVHPLVDWFVSTTPNESAEFAIANSLKFGIIKKPMKGNRRLF